MWISIVDSIFLKLSVNGSSGHTTEVPSNTYVINVQNFMDDCNEVCSGRKMLNVLDNATAAFGRIATVTKRPQTSKFILQFVLPFPMHHQLQCLNIEQCFPVLCDLIKVERLLDSWFFYRSVKLWFVALNAYRKRKAPVQSVLSKNGRFSHIAV